jgi:hypothetical protein
MAGQPTTKATQMTSMSEALQMILQDIGIALGTPDADIQFLTTLQQAVVMQMRQGHQQQQRAAMGGVNNPQSSPGMGSPAGGQMPMGGPGGAMQSSGAPGVPGVRSMPQMPNPDELRRLAAIQAG